MAQAMVDNITRQLADIVSATRELDADCYAQRIRSYLMFSEPQMSFMQRYNVKRSVMLAALVCAVCYLAQPSKRASGASASGWRTNNIRLWDRMEEE